MQQWQLPQLDEINGDILYVLDVILLSEAVAIAVKIKKTKPSSVRSTPETRASDNALRLARLQRLISDPSESVASFAAKYGITVPPPPEGRFKLSRAQCDALASEVRLAAERLAPQIKPLTDAEDRLREATETFDIRESFIGPHAADSPEAKILRDDDRYKSALENYHQAEAEVERLAEEAAQKHGEELCTLYVLYPAFKNSLRHEDYLVAYQLYQAISTALGLPSETNSTSVDISEPATKVPLLNADQQPEESETPPKRTRPGRRPRELEIEEKRYVSLPTAAKQLGVTHGTMHNWATKKVLPDGTELDIVQDKISRHRFISVENVELLANRFGRVGSSASAGRVSLKMAAPNISGTKPSESEPHQEHRKR